MDIHKPVSVNQPNNQKQSEDVQTLDDIETALQQALNEANSSDTRYYIRKALQKIEALRWQRAER